MRELKFRAWDKKRKRMFAVTTINASGAVSVSIDDAGLYLLPAEQIELMQYTGLKDKNGKEIYEGDIVKVEDDEYTPDTNKFLGYNATVKASISKGGAFTVKNWWGEQILNWDVLLRRVEVIGNIHENPELLEEEE